MKKLLLASCIFTLLSSSTQSRDWLVLNLKGYWKFTIGDDLAYAEEFYDDGSWDEIFVPSAWENEGYHGYDGYAWYRVAFELKTETIENENLYLDLGYIDDVDEVFVNGKKIGTTGGFPPNFFTAYNSRRTYYLPKNILNYDQPNIIAVRVFDTVLDGGIISGTVGIFSSKERLAPVQQLQGLWKIKEGRNIAWREPEYKDHYWKETMVPGFWNQIDGDMDFDKFATYRKTFELAEVFEERGPLVVVLGKVDDFDEVYFNGELIGKTKDYRPLGASMSWQDYRVYILPDELINRNGQNVLTVEVEDIGGNAGIYEGPILITYERDHKQVIRQQDKRWRW